MMMILKPLSSHHVSNFRLSVSFLHSVALSDAKVPVEEEGDDAETVFRMINGSNLQVELKESLSSSGIHLSKDLIDRVLKRVRFSHGNPIQTLEFYRYASAIRGFYHSSFSLDTMLYILGRNRKFDQIWELLIETKRKDRSLISPRTMQVVLGRVAKLCSVRQTVESFWKFKRLVPDFFDTACFNALLRTLCQEKSMTDARNVYHSLKHQFQPDLQTFNILLSGWKSSEEAEAFFEEMKEYGCYPDVAAYNAAIRNFCIARRLGDADKLVDEMVKKGLSPNATTYNLFFRVLSLANDLGRSWELYVRMLGNECLPNTQSCMFLIKMFKRHEKVDMAMRLWEDMVVKGFGSYSLVSDVLLDLLCDLAKVEEAEKCLLEMVEKGHRPSNVSFKRIKLLMELANKHDEPVESFM